MRFHAKRGDDANWKDNKTYVCDNATDNYEAQYGQLIVSAGRTLNFARYIPYLHTFAKIDSMVEAVGIGTRL